MHFQMILGRMSCFTYFPAAIHNVPDNTEVRYHRPCDSGCEAYLQTCGVECCDESTVCVGASEVRQRASNCYYYIIIC